MRWNAIGFGLVLLAATVRTVACTGETGDGVADSGPEDSAVDGGPDPGDGGAWEDPPTVTQPLIGSDAILLNPERGFYRTVNLANGGDYSWVRSEGSTLAHSYVRLDDYRDQDLDATLLDAVAQGFDAARLAGIKIVLRFAYNFGPYPNSDPDASKTWVLTHIAQLTPLLQQNSDVIAFVQAGFIGAWGEWHTSTNGLLDDPPDKFDILEALLGAVPSERAVQLRYPLHKDEGYGGPLDGTTAYAGTSASRVGHHNDCFLASDTDYGTWPSAEVELWKTFVEADTQWVPMGGETCALNPPRSDCPTALVEMERFHYTYINHGYHPDVVSSWETQGCREALERYLGYRYVGLSVTAPESVRPGGVIPIALQLRNDGYAPLWNPRPAWIVLTGPAQLEVEVPLSAANPRRWLDGEESRLQVRLQVPASAQPGTYALHLWLPDASAALRADPRYAIALANENLWNPTTGFNQLATLDIDPAAPGSADPSAVDFAVLP